MKRINLIKWQMEHGYTSRFIADKLGVSETTYSLIKNGKTTPTLDIAYKFSEIFNVDNVLELFKKEGD